jgi:hypothetical protein
MCMLALMENGKHFIYGNSRSHVAGNERPVSRHHLLMCPKAISETRHLKFG